jgi:hypothetical protein
MEELSEMGNEIDVNVLINLYNQKISQLSNQIILLEAKVQSLVNDSEKQKKELLMINLEIQKKYDDLLKSRKRTKEVEKYEESGVA